MRGWFPTSTPSPLASCSRNICSIVKTKKMGDNISLDDAPSYCKVLTIDGFAVQTAHSRNTHSRLVDRAKYSPGLSASSRCLQTPVEKLVVNAVESSRVVNKRDTFFSLFFITLSINTFSRRILSRHPLSGRKPACQSERKSPHSFMMRSNMTMDSTLYACGNSPMQRYFVGSSTSPLFLNNIINGRLTKSAVFVHFITKSATSFQFQKSLHSYWS